MQKVQMLTVKREAVAASVEMRILVLRRHKVILDRDLAELYGVSVKRLNEQTKRNQHRFPVDFSSSLRREKTIV